MALGAAIGAVVVGAGGSYMGYEGKKDVARAQEKSAKQAAVQAEERAAEEARIQQEQLEYYSDLAKERAEWEISVSKEKTMFTASRVQDEFEKVTAAQIAGYAASGVSVEVGSPLAVMERTSALAESERKQIFRGHEVFAATRTKEAEEVRRGGEAAYEWFIDRLDMETGYEVENRLAEASAFRKQGEYAQYGQYLSLGSSLLKGYSLLPNGGSSSSPVMSDSLYSSNPATIGYTRTPRLM